MEIIINMKLIIVNFHYVRENFKTPYPSIFGRTPFEFRQQLEILSTLGKFISQEDIKDYFLLGKQLPSKSFLITFDDGLREQYELALPILTKMGIPAIFFINTLPLAKTEILTVHKTHIIRSQRPSEKLMNYFKHRLKSENQIISEKRLTEGAATTYRYDTKADRELKYLLNFVLNLKQQEKYTNAIFDDIFPEQEAKIHHQLYMDAEQIKTLGQRNLIGCHGHSHLPLGQLSPKKQKAEILDSKTFLESITGKIIYTFSYPYGTQEAIKCIPQTLKKYSFIFAFTMERGVNSGYNAPYLLSRFDTNDVPGGKSYHGNPKLIFDILPKKEWSLTVEDIDK